MDTSQEAAWSSHRVRFMARPGSRRLAASAYRLVCQQRRQKAPTGRTRRGFRSAPRRMPVTRRSSQFGCCFQPHFSRSAPRSCKAALVWRLAAPRIAPPRIAPPPGYIRAAQLSGGWCYPRVPLGAVPFETCTPSPTKHLVLQGHPCLGLGPAVTQVTPSQVSPSQASDLAWSDLA